ncbi:MAG: pyridoxamine 5'-phosphate oxidase family protein, partial [Chloroflexi bacterium]|nr:pyridoxamine 5'-phosphate oxidase family protein [Chloroflexota bacterium]
MSNAPGSTPPAPSRPHMPESYGVPTGSEGLLPWSYVTGRMAAARYYWIGTSRPDGRPHTMPTWGVWLDDTLYFGGSPETRWARNLAANPRVSVHLENAEEVVILEGSVTKLTEANADPALLTRLDDAYEAKYNMRHGTPFWRVR